MNKPSYQLTTVAAGLAILSAIVLAEVHPSNEWVSFKGTASFNGNPAPIGSIVDAFDPDGVHCGRFVVGSIVDSAGLYGFMPVYRDDHTAPDTIDEGAEPGQSISFEINGRSATVVSGNPVWTSNGDTATIDLSVTGLVLMTAVDLPTTQSVAPGDTITICVGLRNDGDGLDFYKVRAGSDSSGNNAWISVPQDTLTYAQPNDTVYVCFDVIIAPFAPGDTVFHIPYQAFSCLDTTQRVESTVDVIKTLSDVPDDWLTELPAEFQLDQNYPNPFNPATTISYTLFSRSRVRLEVYDALGRLVDERDLGFRSSGSYSVEYQADQLASGVYFYRLETDYGSQSRKMMVLK